MVRALLPVSPPPHSQRDVVGHPLGLDEVLGLVLSHHVPADATVDAVLQQHGPVHRVRAVQRYVAAVRLGCAADLQHKHDLTVETERGEGEGQQQVRYRLWARLRWALRDTMSYNQYNEFISKNIKSTVKVMMQK